MSQTTPPPAPTPLPPPGRDSAVKLLGHQGWETCRVPGSTPPPALEGGTLTSWGGSWPAAPSSWLPEGLRRAWWARGQWWFWGPAVGLEEGLASLAASLCHVGHSELRPCWAGLSPAGQPRGVGITHTHTLPLPPALRRCFLQTPPHTKHHLPLPQRQKEEDGGHWESSGGQPTSQATLLQ